MGLPLLDCVPQISSWLMGPCKTYEVVQANTISRHCYVIATVIFSRKSIASVLNRVPIRRPLFVQKAVCSTSHRCG